MNLAIFQTLTSIKRVKKLQAAEKLLYDTGIAETKSEVTKEKARDKLGTMIKLYKD